MWTNKYCISLLHILALSIAKRFCFCSYQEVESANFICDSNCVLLETLKYSIVIKLRRRLLSL